MFRPRLTINDLSESFAKVVTQEGVQKRVDATVGVSEDVTDYLHHHRRRGERVHLQGLAYQYHLQRDITDDVVDDGVSKRKKKNRSL